MPTSWTELFFTYPLAISYFPWIQNFQIERVIQVLKLNCFITTSHSTLSNCQQRKKKKKGFTLCWPCDPSSRSRSLKVAWMVEVKGVCSPWHKQWRCIIFIDVGEWVCMLMHVCECVCACVRACVCVCVVVSLIYNLQIQWLMTLWYTFSK